MVGRLQLVVSHHSTLHIALDSTKSRAVCGWPQAQELRGHTDPGQRPGCVLDPGLSVVGLWYLDGKVAKPLPTTLEKSPKGYYVTYFWCRSLQKAQAT